MNVVHHVIPAIEWAPFSGPPAALEALKRELLKWQYTRYAEASRIPGVGANCIGFGSGVLDALYGIESVFPTLPPDTAMHSPATARAVLRTMVRAYPQVRVRTGPVEPGDVLITAESGGGPGHMMIVGYEPNTIWQAYRSVGVDWGGWGMIVGAQSLHSIFKMQERERWK